GEAVEGRGGSVSGARDRLEGTDTALRPLPGVAPPRQAEDCRHHRAGARTRRLHLGDQPRGHTTAHADELSVARLLEHGSPAPGPRSGEQRYRARAGTKPRQGNSRGLLVADQNSTDARTKTQDSPRRNFGSAAKTRE